MGSQEGGFIMSCRFNAYKANDVGWVGLDKAWRGELA